MSELGISIAGKDVSIKPALHLFVRVIFALGGFLGAAILLGHFNWPYLQAHALAFLIGLGIWRMTREGKL